MKSVLDLAPLVGRILMGGFFLLNGTNTALDFPGFVTKLIQTGFPFPIVIAIIIVAVQVLAGIGLVVGYKTRVMALTLAIYTLIISTSSELFIFMQSIAIVGGLLVIASSRDFKAK